MQTTIKRYIRDEKNNPRGVAVAVRKDDEIYYGFSLCNPEDNYDKDLGYRIAVNRALSPTYQLPNVPDRLDAVLSAYEDLEGRAMNYFKDLTYNQISLNAGFRITSEE